jgi:hypothetical protein
MSHRGNSPEFAGRLQPSDYPARELRRISLMKLPGFLQISVCAALLMTAAGASAQLSSPQTGLSAAMMKLFGDVKGFSSQATLRMIEKSNVESMRVPLSLAMLGGKVRAEIDMSAVKSKDLPPEMIASLKQIGLDKVASIVHSDKKLTTIIYPSLRSYAEAPMSSEDAAEVDRKYTIHASKLGNETLDGHPCEKNKVTLTAQGRKREALVWNATDLQKFPLQIQMTEAEGTVVLRLTNVKLVNPDAKLFEAPAGFTKQTSVEKLMQDAMMKALAK